MIRIRFEGFLSGARRKHRPQRERTRFLRLRRAMELFEERDEGYRERVRATYAGTLWRMLRSAG